MGSQAEIKAVITAEDRSNSAIQGFANNIAGVAAGASRAIAGIAWDSVQVGASVAGAAIIGLGIKGLSSANGLQSLQISMDGLTHSMNLGAEAMAGAYAYAQKAPFQLPDVAATTKTLIAYGLTAKQAVSSLDELGNVSITTGIPIQQLGSIFGQVSAQGKLMLQDVRQLTQDGVAILPALQKEFGKTAQQVQDMATAGQISFDQFNVAMKSLVDPKILDLLNNTMPRQMDRLNGSIRVLSNSFVGVGVDATNGFTMASNGIDQAATNLVKKLADTLRAPQVVQAAATVGNALVPLINDITKLITPLIDGFAKLASGISSVGTIAIPALAIMISQIGTFGSTLPVVGEYFSFISGPIVIILGLLGSLVSASPALRSALGGAFDSIKQTLTVLQPVFSQFLSILTNALTTIGTSLAPIIGIVANLFSTLLTAIAPLIPLFATIIVQMIQSLMPVFVQLASTVGPILVQTLIDLAPALVSIAQSLAIILPPVAELTALLIQLGAKVIELGARFIANLAPAMVPIANLIVDIVNHIISFGVELKHLADKIRLSQDYDKFKDIIKAIGVGLLVALGAVKLFTIASELLKSAIVGSTIVTKIAEVAMSDYSIGAKIAQLATMGFEGALAILTSPVTLIVAGITLLVAGLYLLHEHWVTIKPVVDDVKDAMVHLYNDIMTPLRQWFKDAIKFIGDLVSGALHDLGQWFKDAKQWIKDVADAYDKNTGNLKVIADTIGIIVLPALAKLAVQSGITAATMVINGAIALAGWTVGKAADAWGWITNMATVLAQSAIQAAKIAYQGTIAAAGWVVNKVVDSWGWISNLATVVAESAIQAVKIAANGVVAAAGWIADGWRWIANLASVAAAAAADAIGISASGEAASGGWIAGAIASAAAWISNLGVVNAAIGVTDALAIAPIIMPAIVVTAALASLAAVLDAANTVINTISVVQNVNAGIAANKVSQNAAIGQLEADATVGDAAHRASAASVLHKLGVKGYAAGTAFAPGGMAWVGEQGPELVDLPRGSRVIPNSQATQVTQQPNVHITIQAQAFTGSQMEARKFAVMLNNALQDAMDAGRA